MNGDWRRCAWCGRTVPDEEIGIIGACRECWQKHLEDHDTLMRTITWQETGQLAPVGKWR